MLLPDTQCVERSFFFTAFFVVGVWAFARSASSADCQCTTYS